MYRTNKRPKQHLACIHLYHNLSREQDLCPFQGKHTMRSSYSFLLLLLLLSSFTCRQKPAGPPPMIQKITSEGILHFANGMTRLIPHFNDSNYIVLFCVRHAEKVKDGSKDPDLLPEGQERAKRLGRILADVRLDRVCTTTFKRTIQTGEAVKNAAPNNPSLETYPPDSQDVWLESVLAGGGGKKYLAVGHQNTVPQLLNHLTGRFEFQNINEEEFGKLYIAITRGIGATEVVEIEY